MKSAQVVLGFKYWEERIHHRHARSHHHCGNVDRDSMSDGLPSVHSNSCPYLTFEADCEIVSDAKSEMQRDCESYSYTR